MKITILISLLLIGFAVSAAPAPFKIPAGTRFVTEADDPTVSFTEPLSFKGVLVRSSDSRALQAIDIYEFPADKSGKVDSEKCREIVSKILGPSRPNGYKFVRNEVIKGSLCDTRVNETAKHAYIHQRDFRVKQIGGKMYAATARYLASSSSEEDTEFSELFDGLK